jgi:hypothetical protein
MGRFRWIAAVASLLGGLTAWSQSDADRPTWAILTPTVDRWVVPPGQDLRLQIALPKWRQARPHAAIAPGSQPADTAGVVAEPAIERVFANAGPHMRNLAAPRPDAAGLVPVRIDSPDVTLIGLDAVPQSIQMTAAELGRACRAFTSVDPSSLKLPGDRSVTVRVISCARVLVRGQSPASAAIEADPIAIAKSGQAAEVRLYFDPTAMPPGGDLPVRVYCDGSSTPGIRVVATHVPSGATQTVVSGREAYANFRIDVAGEWRIEFRHVVAAPPPDDDAPPALRWDYAMYSASTSFHVPSPQELGP